MTTFVYYIVTMPTEAGVAAFAQFISEQFVAVGMTIDEAKEGKFPKLDKPTDNIDHVILLGNYWEQGLSKLIDESRLSQYVDSPWGVIDIEDIIIYSFGSSPRTGERITYVWGDKMGPAEFFIQHLKKMDLLKGAVEFVYRHHRPVLGIIDDRVLQRDLLKTQAFLTGLYNFPFVDVKTTFDRFLAYFKGQASFEEVTKMGSVIVDAQLQMAVERVRTNSAPVTLKNGLKGVVTDAPDLINLTQDALQRAHPEVQVTLIASLKFGEKTSIAYSIRAMPGLEGIHLGNLMKETIGGGGSDKAAGGRVAFDWDIPF